MGKNSDNTQKNNPFEKKIPKGKYARYAKFCHSLVVTYYEKKSLFALYTYFSGKSWNTPTIWHSVQNGKFTLKKILFRENA